MGAIESLRNQRRNLIEKNETQIGESLYTKPKVSERAKVQAGSVATVAGSLLFAYGAVSPQQFAPNRRCCC